MPITPALPSPLAAMHPVDWVVVVLYMLGMIGVGLWAMTKIKDAGGYMLGSRKLGKVMMFAASFGGGTSSQHPISIASASYSRGLSGMWLSLSYIMLTPVYWIMPPLFRRARIVTMVDFLRQRYGRVMGGLYCAHAVVFGAISMGVAVKAAGTVVVLLSQGSLSEPVAQAVIVGLVLAYGIPGGIVAAYATDVFQGVLILVLSFVLLPYAAAAIGGLDEVTARIPDEMLAMTGDGDAFSPGWIVAFVIGAIFSAFSWPVNATYGAAKNEWAARLGTTGGVLKRFCTLGWVCVGLFGFAYYVGRPDAPAADSLFATLSNDVLPVGLAGLMLAAVLAAVMSTADAGLVQSAAILVNNIYRPLIKPQASPRHYLLMARLLGAASLLAGWAVATQIEDLVRAVVQVEVFGGLVGVAVLASFVWRGTTAAGAIASVAVMSPLFWYGSVFRPETPLTLALPMYLVPGILTLVIVSLFTKQHDEKAVGDFYARIDTPVGQEHLLLERGVKVDELEDLDGERPDIAEADRDTSRRLLLLDVLVIPGRIRRGEFRFSDYHIDLLGIAVLSGFVVVFLLATRLLFTTLFGG